MWLRTRVRVFCVQGTECNSVLHKIYSLKEYINISSLISHTAYVIALFLAPKTYNNILLLLYYIILYYMLYNNIILLYNNNSFDCNA